MDLMPKSAVEKPLREAVRRSIRSAIEVLLLSALFCACGPVMSQISIGIGLPSASIGINVGGYPDLVEVPGYPVYYAPGLDSNMFFYDGLYWVYGQDRWYSSSWYDGPWDVVSPEDVPLFILRVPVQYYRRPPAYFGGWAPDAAPRWGEHWGRDWQRSRSGWDRWDRASAPPAAPLPRYQREYSGSRYPNIEQQHALNQQNYRYQPREPQARRQIEQPQARPAQELRQPSSQQAQPGQRYAPEQAAHRPQSYRQVPAGENQPGTSRAQPQTETPRQSQSPQEKHGIASPGRATTE